MMIRPTFSYLVVLLALTGAYIVAGKLGLSLAAINPSASAVWPPTGLALAAILLLGFRVWPAILVGSAVVNYTTSWSVLPSLTIAGGNTLEAVIGAALACRFAGGRTTFDHADDIVRYVFFAAVPATVLSASVGVTTLALSGQASWMWYAPTWLTWWAGNLVSALTITPLLLIWLGRPMMRLDARRWLEAALLMLIVVAVNLMIDVPIWSNAPTNYPLGYLAILPLLWAAYRFHQHGAITAAAVTCGIATWGTLQNTGPFAVVDRDESLLLLQAYNAVMTLTPLIVAALVAERVRIEQRLRDQEQHMAMALDSGRMGTWQWDIPSGAVTWSRRLEEIHGIAPGAFGGTFESFLADVHPDDVDFVKTSVNRTLELRTDHHIEYRLRLRSGEVRWVEGRGRLALDPAGRPLRLVGVCQDVTARKHAEDEREHLLARERDARAESERANAAKDQFLAVLSHELRTPLTPVMLTAAMMESSPELPEQFRGDVETIRRNVELEARLIDDLLDLTRVTRGKMELDIQPVDMHQLIDRTIGICCPEDRPHVEKDLLAENYIVRADPARIQQVFWNLLSNAVKFTPEQESIQIRSRDTVDGQIVIDISDNGPGIEPSLLPRLFSPFEQGEAARSGKTGGLGLGLAISRAIVAAHGGRIEAVSQGPGFGATFSVTLPTTEAVSLEPPPAEPEPAHAREQRKLRILLVEDHPSTLAVMSRLLAGYGHTVTTAASNAEALLAAETRRFDLVLSDLGLPDGLAYDTMRTLRDRYGITGVALSGYGTEGDIQRSRAAGFAEHLIKPVDLDALVATIARVTPAPRRTPTGGAVVA